MPSSKSKAESKQTFEQSVKRLERIVGELERGEVPLDDALKLYEEGIQLSRACIDKLTQAELRLKKLSKDMKGNFHLVDEDEGSELEE
ncbi:MAG: exodeoxyribonuclease VII small subunit [Bacteroidetes bacterium]|nr:exodeoxyribonuclease VII small subunit [Bacteroidota bacterium]MCW5896297.1 exodeoxyribonuclease VII small subunit [Bacteroidota bacterium]